MRRHMREYLALTAGLLLGLTAVFPGHADSVAYDVSGGLLDPSSYRQVDFADGQRHLIYPGDSTVLQGLRISILPRTETGRRCRRRRTWT